MSGSMEPDLLSIPLVSLVLKAQIAEQTNHSLLVLLLLQQCEEAEAYLHRKISIFKIIASIAVASEN